ncbi:hypothetical protein [Mycobacterium marinum]|uniref:hypothetical protein n=1 Tax=Mycobacterium marinum TaxID=1781 RepID=UPI000E3D5AA6|nr:hypothetical protein [Mycobacterium marinum]MDC9005324.1 hypothetical protein [Mycobacterium marinum]RFZ53646.1 hypothetical protein MSS2_02999 [Mycobacterium marinum]GJO20473.1 hypothetical protein NJB1507_16530 [Mycobacterium marinum]
MATPDDQEVPDVDQLARSMLLLLGDHHDHQESSEQHHGPQPWSKSRDFTNDPQRGAAVRQASLADRERYLTAGLQPVDCRFCHVTVTVKQLGPGHTAVQWNTEAAQRCAHFAEVRRSGGDTARTKACPKMTDSIQHAIAEGVLVQHDPD